MHSMEVFLERCGRNALARLLGILMPIRKASPAEGRELLANNPHAKILFIRPHQGLGDLLLATPIFRALKNAYPALHIHFLADTYNVVAIRGNRRLGRLWIWDKKGMRHPLRFWSFIRALRAEHFAMAVPLSSHIPSFTSYLMARLSGARLVLAYETQPFYGGANWSCYLAHVELPNRDETDPEWVKFMELVRPLLKSSFPAVVGGESMDPQPVAAGDDVFDYTPEFVIGEEDAEWAKEEWEKPGFSSGSRKKIGVFLGGNPGRPERLWPAASWGDLSIKIQADPELFLVAILPPQDFLSGSRARECGVYGEVSVRLSAPPPVFSEDRLSRVAAFLKGLDLFVCVDGGLFHAAVAAGVPTLGLFFKTDPARWAPPVSWQTVLRPSDDRPASLSPDEVYQKVREMVLESRAIAHA